MPQADAYPEWLRPYEPRVPLEELVVRANALFHDCEAHQYDQNHPEMADEWAGVWKDMIAVAIQDDAKRKWNILDFGCGTGFASLQLLRHLPPSQIGSLACYDLSPRMLACCREKLDRICPSAHYCEAPDILPSLGPFNLLATNALLHHLPNPVQTLQQLEPCLASDAIWLGGVEPSTRFYRNQDCVLHHYQFEQERPHDDRHSIARFLRASYWSRKIPKLMGLAPGPKQVTARLAVEQGLFHRKPPAKIIDRLVDFHVPHSISEAEAGRGFDIDGLTGLFAGQWSLMRYHSFAFMGNTPECELPARWKSACGDLAQRYPRDGAYFTAIWRHVAEN